jgi:hypothetical protein
LHVWPGLRGWKGGAFHVLEFGFARWKDGVSKSCLSGSAVASLDTGSGPKPFGMTNVYLGMTKLPELAKRKEKE